MLDALMWWPFLSALLDSSFVSVAFIVAFVGTIFLWLWFLFPFFAQFTIP
jgi:hypothetical protein